MSASRDGVCDMVHNLHRHHHSIGKDDICLRLQLPSAERDNNFTLWNPDKYQGLFTKVRHSSIKTTFIPFFGITYEAQII